MLSKYRQNHVQPKSPAHIGNFHDDRKTTNNRMETIVERRKNQVGALKGFESNFFIQSSEIQTKLY